LADQPHLHGQGHEVLLRAVVEVALEAPAGRVARSHDPGARLLQRPGLAPDLVERFLQRGVEPYVVQREADLPGEVGQHALVLGPEGLGHLLPLHDDEPEQLSGVGDGRDTEVGILASVREQAREPDLHPCGPGHTRASHGLFFLVGEHEPSGPPLRVRHRTLQHAARRPPHFGRREPERLAQRLDHLQ